MEDYNVAVTNEADKGSLTGDMGKGVTVRADNLKNCKRSIREMLLTRCDALSNCADLLTVGAAVVRDDGNEDRAERMLEQAAQAERMATMPQWAVDVLCEPPGAS